MTLCCQGIICVSRQSWLGGGREDQRKKERAMFLDFFLWGARDTLHLGLFLNAAFRMQGSVILFLNAAFLPFPRGALSQRLRLGAAAGGRCCMGSYLPLIVFSSSGGI